MMITLHFHLQPQYKYEIFHIYFTKTKAQTQQWLLKFSPLLLLIINLKECTAGDIALQDRAVLACKESRAARVCEGAHAMLDIPVWPV